MYNPVTILEVINRMKEDRIATSGERIALGLKMRDMRAIDLAQKTGISKSSISHYISGRNLARQDALHQMAKALDVNEAWLMGYDVPPTRDLAEYKKQEDLKVALFGGDGEVTDEMWNEVKAFAQYLKAKHKNDNI